MKKKDGIQRFPRLADDGKLSRTECYKLRVARGDMPRGWNRLTKKQKKVIKLTLRGVSVSDACEVVGFHPDTYYKWLNAHPLFRSYYFRMARKLAVEVDKRLDADLPRAVRVVHDALHHSPDPYFQYDAAIDLLKGRGKFKTNIASQQKIEGEMGIRATADIHHHGLSPEMVTALVNALVGKAQGEVIDVIPTKVVKELPSGSEEIQEDQGREDRRGAKKS